MTIELAPGKCPRCGDGTLRPPEYVYDADGEQIIEGPGNYWCPCCGWEAEDPRDDDGDD